ncbi:hypothetical protein [Actinoplanes regularis]|uniref:Uncharacterized protein n=1 Tax=Actinoplanes regularis TaxID=52697 RepID=A0A238UXM8_9ACTN|nr:hypothetical protein [Actinoplanes regularis]GIE84233.1 hypothetical protein Are01nite_07130 [Actinoplanes regularis]SNR27032.1 hypothetical protein SAMN06264365_101353 [Actinoplanes regularis]
MVRIGVTGHVRLQPSAHRVIARDLRRLLRGYPGVHGVTCLAEGADRLFAEAVMACRGSFEAVLPVPEISAAPEEDRSLRSLLRFASDVTKITVPGPPEASYTAASHEMVLRSDVLVAVWDGSDEGLRGGTAETVEFARQQGREVRVVWPELPPDCQEELMSTRSTRSSWLGRCIPRWPGQASAPAAIAGSNRAG